MIYRKATIEDIPLLVDLRIEFLYEANGKKFEREDCLRHDIFTYFSAHMPNEEFIAWLCVDNAEVIGTSGISFYKLPPNYFNPNGYVGYIMNMYTKKQFRRRGIATTLFAKMLDEGAMKKIGKYVLHATPDGKKLYEKFGFAGGGDEMHLAAKDIPVISDKSAL